MAQGAVKKWFFMKKSEKEEFQMYFPSISYLEHPFIDQECQDSNQWDQRKHNSITIPNC
jgi:hypothetical protein